MGTARCLWGQPGTHRCLTSPSLAATNPASPSRCGARSIQQHSFLTRKRIRRRFSKSLRKIGGCQTDGRYLKLKYLLDLERLQRRWAEENFHVRSPGSAADIVIYVAGESGISWSCGGSEVRVGGCTGAGVLWWDGWRP